MKMIFNTKKKNKDQAYVKLIIKKSKNDEPELIEKDIHMGLYVLASEKHESRRIDNQLRGRS
jgi:preprotein translocase subunit SecA